MFILHVPSSNYILILLFCLIWYLKNSKIKILFQTVYPTVLILLILIFFVILHSQSRQNSWFEKNDSMFIMIIITIKNVYGIIQFESTMYTYLQY